MRSRSRGATIDDVEVVDGTSNVDRWSSRRFLGEVTAWVAEVAEQAGRRLSGRWDQPHVRPWSSAVRFGAEGGDLWFKVNGEGTRHEGPLLRVLSELEPRLVPSVLAVDAARGWSLTEDVGPVMRMTAPPDQLAESWRVVLVGYAEAQLRLADHAAAVRSTGLPEVSPETMPRQLRSLVDELSVREPDEGGLTTHEVESLSHILTEYDAWCAELAGSGIPCSVQHDDLHSSNVGWADSATGPRVIDWGDAVWGFPLSTMLATMNSMAWHLRCEVDDPRVVAARDAYLEPFRDHADGAALARYVGLARRTGCVGKALSYRSALLGEPSAAHRELDFPVRGWLLETLVG